MFSHFDLTAFPLVGSPAMGLVATAPLQAPMMPPYVPLSDVADLAAGEEKTAHLSLRSGCQ